jgi:hypothetical protein
LLESAGRVTANGRFSAGLIGVRKADKIGHVTIGIIICGLPIWGMQNFASASAIIEPDGVTANLWRYAVRILTLLAIFHLFASIMRYSHCIGYLNPWNSVWIIRNMRTQSLLYNLVNHSSQYIQSLQLLSYFWLGLRGYIGALVWLTIPIFMLSRGHLNPAIALLGGVLMVIVILPMPYLQAKFAYDRNYQSLWDRRTIRHSFQRAPIVMTLAFVIYVLLTIPLYLLKIEAIPRGLLFVEGVLFIFMIWPARILSGWALHRGIHSPFPRSWIICWICRLLMVTTATAYTIILWASQHISWSGMSSLFQQHAFLLPGPTASLLP